MGKLVLIATGLLLGLALIGPTTVSGHADYDHSTPGDSEVVASPPAIVHVYFTNPVEPGPATFLNVVNSLNVDVDNNDMVIDPGNHKHMSITLQGALPNGVYTVQWGTTEEGEGHTEEGEFHFTIAAPSVGGLGSDTVSAGSGGLGSAAISAVTVALIAILTVGGGAWFVRRHS